MAHKKYTVFRDQIEKLQGRIPDQAWAEETVRLLVEAGATQEDLQEVSEQIKAMAILKARHSLRN